MRQGIRMMALAAMLLGTIGLVALPGCQQESGSQQEEGKASKQEERGHSSSSSLPGSGSSGDQGSY